MFLIKNIFEEGARTFSKYYPNNKCLNSPTFFFKKSEDPSFTNGGGKVTFLSYIDIHALTQETDR